MISRKIKILDASRENFHSTQLLLKTTSLFAVLLLIDKHFKQNFLMLNEKKTSQNIHSIIRFELKILGKAINTFKVK